VNDVTRQLLCGRHSAARHQCGASAFSVGWGMRPAPGLPP